VNIEKAILDAKEHLEYLYKERDDRLARTLIRCMSSVLGEGCGKRTQIRKLEYIQTHWYESPYGCNGGDLWHEDEGQFDCPKCGVRNRLYDRPEIEKLKHLFNGVRKTYPS